MGGPWFAPVSWCPVGGPWFASVSWCPVGGPLFAYRVVALWVVHGLPQ